MSVDEEDEFSCSDIDHESEQYSQAADAEPGPEGAEDSVAGAPGLYNFRDINDQVFEELILEPSAAEEVKTVWQLFMSSAESREAAGEAVYAALFDSAPSLQSLFKTARAVMAIRIMNGLNQLVSTLQDPRALKVLVETLGFQHMDLEITTPRVGIFRDALVDLLQLELGERFTQKSRDCWCTFMNYIGGAYIYVRVKYADRLKILASSWATANNRRRDEQTEGEGDADEGEGAQSSASAEAGERPGAGRARPGAQQKPGARVKHTSRGQGWLSSRKSSPGSGSGGKESSAESGESAFFQNAAVPTTYNDMFQFNCAVMGFGGQRWTQEVLASFDTIVNNVSNSYRLQEECDVLSLRIAKYGRGTINLSEYKAVMLASLRSLVPKDWNSAHEVAWSWLWENVERMLKAIMGKPVQQEKALEKLWDSLDDEAVAFMRRELYSKFFALAPSGQNFFKQSTTRLHFVADKVRSISLEMYKDPKKVVEDLSAMGLRHVGYGIPTDLFGPFVTAAVQVVRTLTTDDMADEAFRWSLSLVSRILTRVITEGSTVVMRAINANSAKMLKKAVGCAPRGKRALWMLNITVGTQSISPLLWAIETGSLEAARAVMLDLLTIRGDRDRYYYGVDTLFERHPDIVKRLCLDAPALLPTLLDGLVWRSRVTESGQRRVNYYIRHLVVDEEGGFSKATECLTDFGDPKIACHPIVALVTDTVWGKVAFRTFLFGKAWFLFTLAVFILSQAILNHLDDDKSPGLGETTTPKPVATTTRSNAPSTSQAELTTDATPLAVRVAILICRCFIYVCSMGQGILFHAKSLLKDLRSRTFVKFCCLRIPAYVCNWEDLALLSLTTALLIMLCMEPLLHCAAYSMGDNLFTEHCKEAEHLLFPYSLASSVAILLYFVLLTDLSVFSTRVSAFALVCGRVLSELALFLSGLTFIVLAFAAAISALVQHDPDSRGIPEAALMLYQMTFGMFSGEQYDTLHDSPAIMVVVFAYVITTVVFLLNLLIAQLSCSYLATYQDMLGYARLNRGKIVAEIMPLVPSWRWRPFVAELRLDERVEFGEGDLGLAGGMQVMEAASANITTVDTIRRFGGSTSPAAQWPEEEGSVGDEEDHLDRMERLVGKAMKRMSAKGSKRRGGQAASTSAMSASAMDSGSSQGIGSD